MCKICGVNKCGCRRPANRIQEVNIVKNYKQVQVVGFLSGTTVQRPANPKAGFMYFDATLVLPIWWAGEFWVDSNGTEV